MQLRAKRKQSAPLSQTQRGLVAGTPSDFSARDYPKTLKCAKAQKKMDAANTKQALARSREILSGVENFTTQAIHEAILPLTT